MIIHNASHMDDTVCAYDGIAVQSLIKTRKLFPVLELFCPEVAQVNQGERADSFLAQLDFSLRAERAKLDCLGNGLQRAESLSRLPAQALGARLRKVGVAQCAIGHFPLALLLEACSIDSVRRNG